MSLIEVLISILVLTLGVLGVASLLPVAGFQTAEASRLDRAAAVGRAAMNEVKLRGLLDPRMWEKPQNWNRGDPFVIDPLGPKKPDFLPNMPRMKLRAYPDANTIMKPKAAETIFRSGDDLNFKVPEDGDQPPTQNFLPAGSQQKRLADGRYSWLVTAVPALNQKEMYRVSIAVLHNRDTDPLRERRETFRPLPFVAGTSLKFNKISDLKRDSWVLLYGKEKESQKPYFGWYRIKGVRKLPNGGGFVSFAGPVSTAKFTEAAIFDTVVGVYEYSMRIEDPSLWTENGE